MDTLPIRSAAEQKIGGLADYTRNFELAYDTVADTIGRDTSEDLSRDWSCDGLFELILPTVDETVLPPSHGEWDGLPLADWVEGQASWYDRCPLDGSDLIAAAIRRIGHAAEMHACQTVSEIVERSPLFRRAVLRGVTTPEERPRSMLAAMIDAEVEAYLRERGELARLVAWVLFELAEEADWYEADNQAQFVERKAAADREAPDEFEED